MAKNTIMAMIFAKMSIIKLSDNTFGYNILKYQKDMTKIVDNLANSKTSHSTEPIWRHHPVYIAVCTPRKEDHRGVSRRSIKTSPAVALVSCTQQYTVMNVKVRERETQMSISHDTKNR